MHFFLLYNHPLLVGRPSEIKNNGGWSSQEIWRFPLWPRGSPTIWWYTYLRRALEWAREKDKFMVIDIDAATATPPPSFFSRGKIYFEKKKKTNPSLVRIESASVDFHRGLLSRGRTTHEYRVTRNERFFGKTLLFFRVRGIRLTLVHNFLQYLTNFLKIVNFSTLCGTNENITITLIS